MDNYLGIRWETLCFAEWFWDFAIQLLQYKCIKYAGSLLHPPAAIAAQIVE